MRLSLLLVAAPLTACGLAGQSVPKTAAPLPKLATETAFCGPDDQPETGYQGQTPLADMANGRSQQPYYCGLKIVGHNDILNRGENWQLARIGDCAYVATLKPLFSFSPNEPVTTRDPAGVAVIDARDPAKPRLVQILRSPGSVDAVENMASMDAGARKVLAAGAYNGGGTLYQYENSGNRTVDEQIGPALDIFDASEDCTQPKLMTTYIWPSNVHDIAINRQATRIYGAVMGTGNVYVLDISDMAKPKLLTTLELELPDGSSSGLCHTPALNADETRLYCPSASVSSAAAPDDTPTPVANPIGVNAGPTIWDISEIPRGIQDPQAYFVGEADIKGQGAHHAVPAVIGGKPYVVAANELSFGVCENSAFPRIFDISDETAPVRVGEFRMEVLDHCDESDVKAETGMGNQASHYNNVDNYENTTLGLFTMTSSGLRVVDLRDPARPREVAYYKPGANPDTTLAPAGAGMPLGYHIAAFTDACGGRAWLNDKTGHIWFACQGNGFYIAELSPEVRAYLSTPLPTGN